MVTDILEIARRRLFPEETPLDRAYSRLALYDIQPEMLFEQVLTIVGEDFLTLWNVLRRPAQGDGSDLAKWSPNLYHYAIVWIASRHGTPIVTFNMDTLFEDAATRLGLVPNVYVAGKRSTDSVLTREYEPGNVSIWKLHGCLETTDDWGRSTLFRTMTQIAQPNRAVMQSLERLLPSTHLCIVGYSGRDVDFFPHLCRIVKRSSTNSPFWIDPVFKVTSLSRRTARSSTFERSGLLGAERYSNDLFDFLEIYAHGVIAELASSLPSISKLSESIRNRTVANAVAQRNADCRELVVHNEAMLSLRSPSLAEKRALLVSALLYSGNTWQGYRYAEMVASSLKQSLPSSTRLKFLLDHARLCDWNSKYEEYMNVTASLRAESKLFCRNTPLAPDARLFATVSSLCLLARAKHMLMGPVSDLEWSDPRFTFRVPAITKLRSFQLHVSTSLRTGPRLLGKWISRHMLHRTPESPFELLARQFYLDHHQVLLTLCFRWITDVGRRLGVAIRISGNRSTKHFDSARRWIRERYSKIRSSVFTLALLRQRSRVERAGSAYTQADLDMFIARYSSGVSPQFARHIWNLIGHPVGLALSYLAEGQHYIHDHRIAEAIQSFEEAYRVSTCCGNHLTALKSLIALAHADRGNALVRGKAWQSHLAALTGESHRAYFEPRTMYFGTDSDRPAEN
jgi:hypothetical protein